jgi:hypothetical protein
MDGENRIPPALIVALVLVVLVIGAAAYYAGRFRRSPRLTSETATELPPPAAPAPDVAEPVETPAEIPPTVTPSVPVVVEKGARSSGVMVQKSTQIVVPVPPIVPTVVPAGGGPIEPDRYPTARRRIIIEVRPTLTPTVPEVELGAPPPPVPTPEPPPELEETPEPEPEPTARPLAVVRPGSVRPGGSLTDRIGMDRALRVPGAAQQLVQGSRRDPGNELSKRLAQLGS